MLRSLLFFPALFWLLVPPGVCICHLPETILAAVAGSPAPAADPNHEEEDHAPWCTVRKMPVLAQDAPAVAEPSVAENLALIESLSDPLPLVFLASTPPGPSHHASDQPIYLTLRALLI